MHYSQGGAALSEWGSSGPYVALTTNDCVGCHTAPAGTQINGAETPYVDSIQFPIYDQTGTEANTNTLAGGSFFWMRSDAATGHNVEGITFLFDMIPPGHDPSLPGARGPWPQNQNVTCAGTYGCHGTQESENPYVALKGGHHGEDFETDGVTLARSYRLLHGVSGKEDPQWEYRPSRFAHNQYKAVERVGGTGLHPDSSTISYVCYQCHGEFHSSSDDGGTDSEWFRHPTDVRLPGEGEYLDFNDGTNFYSLVTPVGSENVSVVLTTVTPGSSDCIVICISCHRPHGSPFYKTLRWDYKNWPASGVNGCGICHTSSN